MNRAFVMVNAEWAKIRTILAFVRSKSFVLSAKAVTGPYDIILEVQFTNTEELGPIVLDIGNTDGVTKTLTSVVLPTDQKN